jgi:hypothetical protein
LPKNKSRNSKSYRRSQSTRPPYDRVLIVCEGSKTEPNYFNEIRQEFRIPVVHVRVTSGTGTEPIQVVQSAIDFFNESKEFERVFAVFDRDDHLTYHDAVQKAEAYKSKLKTREKQQVSFEAIASVPSFEVWFLMHFENVTAYIHRDKVLEQLLFHMPDYSKGSVGTYNLLRERIADAKIRAQSSRIHNTRSLKSA